MKYKKGDKVRVIKEDSIYYGRVGEITDVTTLKYCYRVQMGINFGGYKGSELQLIKGVIQNEI